MTFNEIVQVNAGFDATVYKADDTPFDTIPAASITANATTVTIPPSMAFTGDQGYYVLIPGGLIGDKINAYAGISDETVWSFTALADTFPPALNSAARAGTPPKLIDGVRQVIENPLKRARNARLGPR